MSRQPITVKIDPTNHVAHVVGYHAKQLIHLAGGRLFWSRRSKAWVTTEVRARDVIAMAEADNIPVDVAEFKAGAR